MQSLSIRLEPVLPCPQWSRREPFTLAPYRRAYPIWGGKRCSRDWGRLALSRKAPHPLTGGQLRLGRARATLRVRATTRARVVERSTVKALLCDRKGRAPTRLRRRVELLRDELLKVRIPCEIGMARATRGLLIPLLSPFSIWSLFNSSA